MNGRKLVLGLAALALAVGCAGQAQAQRTPYGVQEFNAYVDTTPQQTPDPQQRLQVIEGFLQKYPESVLRAFVYPNQAQTAFALQQYEGAMEAVGDFLALDRGQVQNLLRQSNYNDIQIDNHYYTAYVLYSYAFLQLVANNPEKARVLSEEARERGRQGLELHQQLYSQVSPPQDPQQRQAFEREKQRAEAALRSLMSPHAVLANAFWQKKDYATAAREYAVALEENPDEPMLNYRLGAASLQSSLRIGMSKDDVTKAWGRPDRVNRTVVKGLTVDQWCYGESCERAAYLDNEELTGFQIFGAAPEEIYTNGFWHLARAIGLGIPKSDNVRTYLTGALAVYQQVPPECLGGEVDNLVAVASQSAKPPSHWRLIRADEIDAVQQAMSVKTIFDELQKGGEAARLMFLAACGTEIGIGQDGQPELAVMVLEVTQSEDNLVTLRAAAGQEAVEAKQANVEVKVVEPEEAKNLKPEDVVRISGKISGYESEPQFVLKLSEGKVHPEDL